MKIISGFLKGRNIKGYNIDGTRPTMDRVKESVFSMIQDYINESVVLDLFAGSGNLGLEAISNYAEICYFVDNNKKAFDAINDNVANFDINNKCVLINKTYKDALKYFKDNNIKFDLVFLDPPYNMNIIKDIMLVLNECLLNEGAIIVCEMESNYIGSFDVYGYQLIKERRYSNKYVNIYKKTK